MALKKLLRRLSTAGSASGSSSNSIRGSSSTLKDLNQTDHSSYTDTSSENSARSTSTTSKASQLEVLASQKKWDEVLKFVSGMSHAGDCVPVAADNNKQEESVVSSASGNTTATTTSVGPKTTPLHLVMQHQPPLKIVEALIGLHKSKFSILCPEEYQDDLGRTPLHVAAQYGAEEEVTERFLNGDHLLMPAIIRDKAGRTALHVAVLSPLNIPLNKNGKPVRKGSYHYKMVEFHKKKLICCLLEHYGEAAALADNHGKTPMDYARELDLKHNFAISRVEFLEKFYSLDSYQEDNQNRQAAGDIMGLLRKGLEVPTKNDDCSTIGMVGIESSALMLEEE